MKEITVISGKGGTGKTSVTAALATIAKNVVICDSDVDAANLHLILHPKVREAHQFYGNWVASINQELCTHCRICIDLCRFDAISINNTELCIIDPYKCEGCRLCERMCPVNAIVSEQSTSNFWYVSDTRVGTMTHARMGPGEENSGKLVTQVRRKARELAREEEADIILNDGPPGIGCPAIASLTGSTQVLLVMEASESSLHDAQRVIELVRQFRIPLSVLINKWDINPELTKKIEVFLEEQSLKLLGKIPFDKSVVEAMIQHKTITEYAPESEISHIIRSCWDQLLSE